MEIVSSARQHGITDEDMLHGARHAIVQIPSTGAAVMVIGPARNGDLLEVGILDDEVIIHADILRPKFYRYLKR